MYLKEGKYIKHGMYVTKGLTANCDASQGNGGLQKIHVTSLPVSINRLYDKSWIFISAKNALFTTYLVRVTYYNYSCSVAPFVNKTQIELNFIVFHFKRGNIILPHTHLTGAHSLLEKWTTWGKGYFKGGGAIR